MAFAAPPGGMGKLDSVVGVIEKWRRDQIVQETIIITQFQLSRSTEGKNSS
jgi:hypothetical protein